MKRIVLAACILAVVSMFVLAQTQQKVSSSTERYQLIPARVDTLAKSGGVAEFRTAFLLDSETGTVWQYEGMGVIGDKQKNDLEVMFPPHFSRLGVDGLDGWSVELMWKKVFGTQQEMRKRREQRKRP